MRRSRRICQSTRLSGRDHAPLPRMIARNARLRSLSPVRSRSSSGVVAARIAPSRIRSRSSHSARLLHRMARDEQRRAAVGELAERLPEVGAQDRVEPDRRLVEHEHRRAVQERRRERDARALPARERVHDLPRGVLQRDLGDHLADPLRRRACHGCEVAQVLGHRQVAVDRRRLGEVADLVPERRRAGVAAEDRHAAAGDDLDADDRRASASTCRSRSGRAAPSPGRERRRPTGPRSPCACRGRRGGARSRSSQSSGEA